jgi:four helix bundle protein
MGKEGFRELKVWHKARELAVYIYKLTNSDVFKKDFGLKDQIRRASVSVASNIAEGDERDTNKDSVRFLYIAKGSLAELLTQVIIAKDINYISEDEIRHISEECDKIGRMLGKLIKIRSLPITYNP